MTRDNNVILNLSKSMVVIAASGSTASNTVHQLRIRTGTIQVISYTKMCNIGAHYNFALYIYYYYYYYYLSTVSKIFIIIYLKQTTFFGVIMLYTAIQWLQDMVQ